FQRIDSDAGLRHKRGTQRSQREYGGRNQETSSGRDATSQHKKKHACDPGNHSRHAKQSQPAEFTVGRLLPQFDSHGFFGAPALFFQVGALELQARFISIECFFQSGNDHIGEPHLDLLAETWDWSLGFAGLLRRSGLFFGRVDDGHHCIKNFKNLIKLHEFIIARVWPPVAWIHFFSIHCPRETLPSESVRWVRHQLIRGQSHKTDRTSDRPRINWMSDPEFFPFPIRWAKPRREYNRSGVYDEGGNESI